MTREEAEENAQWMIEVANSIGKLESAIKDWVVGDYCRPLRDHPEVVDALTGPEIDEIRERLREGAMLLDRAALIKSEGEES
jgi:hypothetical protein